MMARTVAVRGETGEPLGWLVIAAALQVVGVEGVPIGEDGGALE